MKSKLDELIMHNHQYHHYEQQTQSGFKGRMLKLIMGIMAFCLAGYIVGPPLYWHISENLATTVAADCPPCLCNCSSDIPILSLPQGCMKQDPQAYSEVEKNLTIQLKEELRSREEEAHKNQQKVDMRLLEAKRMASQYSKDADKCNSGMGTCEEAREKVEELLQSQMKMSALWELRARNKGWGSNTKRRTRRVRKPRRNNIVDNNMQN